MNSRNVNWDENNRRLVDEGRQALERTSASLARSNQIAIETESVGTEVNAYLILSLLVLFNFFVFNNINFGL